MCRWPFAYTYLSLWLLYSCVPDTTHAPARRDLPEILHTKELHAMITVSPTGYFIHNGKPVGFEYEMLKDFAASIHARLILHPIRYYDSVLYYLQSKQVDILALPLSAMEKKKKNNILLTDLTYPSKIMMIINPHNLKQHPDTINIYLRKHSAFTDIFTRYVKNDSIVYELHLLPDTIQEEKILSQVNQGTYDATLLDINLYEMYRPFFPHTAMLKNFAIPQTTSWIVRKNSPKLHQTLNKWLKKKKKSPEYKERYHHYFESPSPPLLRSYLSYLKTGKLSLSPIDKTFQQAGKKIGVDWKLLAAIAYQESRFNPDAVSPKQASGIMQLVPETAQRFNLDSSSSTIEHIIAGGQLYKLFLKRWIKIIQDSTESVKFSLASYNAGMGHVLDAYRLALAYQKNARQWENIRYFLLHKNEKQYQVRNDLVKHGKCRCTETVKYVENVLSLYQIYSSIPMAPP